jgi:hypothetical protein
MAFGMAVPIIDRCGAGMRRSNRVALATPVALTGKDQASAPFSLNANATNLNRHGAALQLSRELTVGTVVVVKNRRGAQLSARIVAQVSAMPGKHTYGIEFVEDSDSSRKFWGIVFPSEA